MAKPADQMIEELETSPASLVTGEDLDDAFDETKMGSFFEQALDGEEPSPAVANAVVEPAANEVAQQPVAVEMTEKLSAAEPDRLAEMQGEIDRLKEEAEEAKKLEDAAKLKAETDAALGEEPAEYVDPMTSLSDEVRDSLEQYNKDWPEIAAAEKVHRDVMAQRVGTIIEQMTTYFEAKITTLQDQLGSMTTSQNEVVLTSAVDDYDTVIKDVQVWVGKQPEFLQHSYQNVLDNGTVNEKLELVAVYKDTLPAEQKIEQAPKPSQASIDALTPVVTKRGSKPISNEVDKDDEESAFKEATALLLSK